MTEPELAAVMRGIAPVVREFVGKATAEAATRIAVLETQLATLVDLRDRVVIVETKAAVPLPAIVPVDLSPVLERLAAIEARQAVLGDVRDRLVTVETKAAIVPDPVPTVDLSPVWERLAATDARLAVLGDVRDRVITVETKAAMHIPIAAPVDLSQILERLEAVEQRPTLTPAFEDDVRTTISALRERVAVVEVKAEHQALPLPPEAGVDELRDRIVDLETKAAGPSPAEMGLVDLRTTLASVQAKVFDVSERVAVVETRAPVPGPAGKDGQDGQHGKDGLGFEDLDVSLVGDRTLMFRWARGDQEKSSEVVVDWPVYKRKWVAGVPYVRGDVVTWEGHNWHCEEPTTTAQPGASKAWLQSVTRGARGKDGQDGRNLYPPPVVTIAGKT